MPCINYFAYVFILPKFLFGEASGCLKLYVYWVGY